MTAVDTVKEVETEKRGNNEDEESRSDSEGSKSKDDCEHESDS